MAGEFAALHDHDENDGTEDSQSSASVSVVAGETR